MLGSVGGVTYYGIEKSCTVVLEDLAERLCVLSSERARSVLQKTVSRVSRFPTLADSDTTCKKKNSTMPYVLLRCIVRTIWGGSGLRVRLVITFWVIRYHLLSAKSVWSLLVIKHCVGNKSGSVTTGCYLNNGVEILSCARNQWIGWSVWQIVINIRWLYDEVAQLFGYLSAYFVRLASSWLADWSGDVDCWALSFPFEWIVDIFVNLLVPQLRLLT